MNEIPDDLPQKTVIKAEWLDGQPIAVHCRCGGVVTIMPPFQEMFVICPACEARLETPLEQGANIPLVNRLPSTGIYRLELGNGEKIVATRDHLFNVKK